MMTIETTEATKAAKIIELNDRFRQGDHTLGQVSITSSISCLSSADQQELFRLLRSFDDFTSENDPYREHGFGCFEFKGEIYNFMIEYFDKTLRHGSQDPSNPAVTIRVLTLMHSSEY